MDSALPPSLQVNLKEQGQLIRQDEFTVWTGRRRCQRHVFLFEELVLFSKPKKMEGALAVFIYKQSFKVSLSSMPDPDVGLQLTRLLLLQTADVGLTESTGNNGLQFEIWFRRRRSKSNTVILQALTEEVKNAWTADITRILWAQANRNKGRGQRSPLVPLACVCVCTRTLTCPSVCQSCA